MPYKKKETKLWGNKKPHHFKNTGSKLEQMKELSTDDVVNSLKETQTASLKGDTVAVKKTHSKKQKTILTFGIIVTVLALIASGIFAFFLLNGDKNNNIETPALAGGPSAITIPAGYFEEPKVEHTFLKSMKAIKLVPKKDFLMSGDMSKEAISAEVDEIIKNLKTLQFNSIIIDTKQDNRVIFDSEIFEKTSVDALSILMEKAKAAQISVVAIYHLNDLKTADGTLISSHLSYVNKAFLFDGAAELARKYQLDSILLDDYYVNKNAIAYEQFMAHGGIGNYEDWLLQNTSVTIEGAAEAIRNASNAIPTGLLVKDVWANEEQNKLGSKTKSDFCALMNGFADTKGMVETKAIDFINAEIPTTIENTAVPFHTISSWWSTVCKTVNMPLYITHNTANANVAGAGTDQLAIQVSKSMKLSGYHGSAFTNLKVMMDNMSENKSTDILLKYYADNYAEEDLNQGLAISTPKKQQFTTYEESVQFRGKFDPNQEVILNGKKVTPSERGGFSVWVDLKVGKNNIVLEHKGKKTTYVVERKVIILKKWSPTKAMKVAGSSEIEFNVMAYKGSKITATINGTTVTLQEGGAGEDNVADSAYRNFQGTYKCPKAGNKEQNIGSITFKGSYQGYAESQKGSSIIVDKIPDEVDPDSATGQTMLHAVVKDRYANTYPYLTTPGYPQAILYQLPQGTQDIVQSVNGDFVNLRSGKTVKSGAVSLQDLTFEGNNAITEFTAGSDGGKTVIRATLNWKAPFSIMPSPYPTTPEETKNYSFGSDKVVLLFDYTTRIDKDRFMSDISSSPVFSGMTHERVKNEARNIWQYKVTLTLRQSGRYYGCHAEYEGNTLVLKFNNPPQSGSLSGITIAVDPGHGGNDNGTMAGGDILEKDANMIMAEKVKAQLEALGASVVMTRTGDTNPSLAQRVDTGHANKVDLFISCHHNSAGSNSAPNGVETYFNAPFSEPLARSVQAQLGQYMNNRGHKSSVPNYNFVVTREKQFPSILIEYGFLSNPGDEALALDPTHQDNMARATAQGVLNYFN